VSLSGYQVNVITKNLTNAVALDFHWEEHKVYWSDVTSAVSKIMRMNEDGTNIEVMMQAHTEIRFLQ